MSDTEEFNQFLSLKIIELWTCKNSWTLQPEHLAVLQKHFQEPRRVAYGLDELGPEYHLLYGLSGRNEIYSAVAGYRKLLQ